MGWRWKGRVGGWGKGRACSLSETGSALSLGADRENVVQTPPLLAEPAMVKQIICRLCVCVPMRAFREKFGFLGAEPAAAYQNVSSLKTRNLYFGYHLVTVAN